jgi:hypothetical protein
LRLSITSLGGVRSGKGTALTDDQVIAMAAVAAARELAGPFGRPLLQLDVETALRSRETAEQPGQFVDPVALGSLFVSIASLAWQVYCDKKKGGDKPTQDTLTRIVRIRRRETSDLSGAEEKIIEIVAGEIIKAAGDEE